MAKNASPKKGVLGEPFSIMTLHFGRVPSVPPKINEKIIKKLSIIASLKHHVQFLVSHRSPSKSKQRRWQ
jgi:hypothetical protein